jgi:hypothetical protein
MHGVVRRSQREWGFGQLGAIDGVRQPVIWMNVVAVVTLIGLGGLTSAVAQQDLDIQLKKILETAADICYTVEQRGRKSESQLKGEVQAKLSGIIAKLADLGGAASGYTDSQEWQGLSQEALGAALKESANCRERVFNTLLDRILPPVRGDMRPFISPSDVSGQYNGIVVVEAQTVQGPAQAARPVRLIIDSMVSGDNSFHGTLIGLTDNIPDAYWNIVGKITRNHITFTAYPNVNGPNEVEMYFDGSVLDNSIEGVVTTQV